MSGTIDVEKLYTFMGKVDSKLEDIKEGHLKAEKEREKHRKDFWQKMDQFGEELMIEREARLVCSNEHDTAMSAEKQERFKQYNTIHTEVKVMKRITGVFFLIIGLAVSIWKLVTE